MHNKFFPSLLSIFLLLSIYGHSQTTSFLSGGIDELLRREQLNGKGSSQNSFMLRSFNRSIEGIDSLTGLWPKASPLTKSLPAKSWSQPFTIEQVYNTNHPYGWNDGSMVPTTGVSIKVSGGVRMAMGKLVIQLQPELVLSQNKDFETFFTENNDTTWSRYYRFLNKIDMPEKFGDHSYKKIFGGQSSIRYNMKTTSVGISTENMWWGPGTRNALVMSNNAPGFLHVTYNTTKPVQTGIGSFEWQVIGGKLSNSGVLPVENYRRYTTGTGYLYEPKNEDGRYLTGMVLSWQPKWVKGLFIGFAKASYMYQSDMSILDLLPIEGIVRTTSQKEGKKASLGSLFVRYVMPEEKAEFYMEYGRNDKSPNLINLVTESRYPRAYVAGMKKVFAGRNHSYIEFSGEITQMQLPAVPDLIHAAKSWYLDDYVRQGYTNMGQVMGAGIGPGSNSQMLGVAWIKGIRKVGVMFERVVHNNDFYYYAFEDSGDFRRHWVDLSTTVSTDWSYDRLLFSARMALIRSLNYEWWYSDFLPQTSPTNYFQNGYDVLNFHASLSLAYRL